MINSWCYRAKKDLWPVIWSRHLSGEWCNERLSKVALLMNLSNASVHNASLSLRDWWLQIKRLNIFLSTCNLLSTKRIWPKPLNTIFLFFLRIKRICCWLSTNFRQLWQIILGKHFLRVFRSVCGTSQELSTEMDHPLLKSSTWL